MESPDDACAHRPGGCRGGDGRTTSEPSAFPQLEHQPMEGFFDEAHPPGVGRGLEVLQVVVAVDVDEIVPAVLVREPAMPGEPFVEDEVVPLDPLGGLAARALAPDDERPAAVGHGPGDGAEPPSPRLSSA